MWNRLANIVLRNRFLILGVFSLLTVLFGYNAVTGLKIENKYGNMLPKDTETQITYLKFKENFGEDGSTLVIAIEDKYLYTEDHFKAWKELGEKILQINGPKNGVDNVFSEAKLFMLVNDTTNHNFVVKPSFVDKSFQEKSIDSIHKEVRTYPIFNGMLYNDTNHVSLMMVKIDESFLQDKTKQQVVLDIENLARSYEKKFGKVHFAGLPHMRVLIGKRILNEMYIFIALSIFVSSLIMYFFFRSVRVTMICNLVVVITVVWALGSIAMCGYHVSIMMALIPPLMIVIGIPNCIYLYNKYHQEFRAHRNKARALHRTIRKTGTAMWLTNVTTAFGFITFLFTNSDKFFEFGVISSINIMFCYIVSIALIPIFASFSKSPPERHLRHLDRKQSTAMLEKLVTMTRDRRPLIYTVTIIITAVSAVGIYFMKVTGNITGDLPKDDPILKDVQFMESNFGGAVPFEVMIHYKEKGRLFAKGTMNSIGEVQTMFENDTLFAKTLSIVDLVKVVNMAYYGNDINRYEIISNKDKLQLKEYFDKFAINNSSNAAFSLKDLVDTTHCILRVRTQMKDLGSYEVSDEVAMVKHRIDSIMNPDKPELERLFKGFEKGKKSYADSIIDGYNAVNIALTEILSKGSAEKQLKFDSDPELVKTYFNKPGFKKTLRKAIDKTYFDVELTGTSVVASEGTQYLVNSLLQSIVFAIISIAALMCVLFYSLRMVIVSMIPNIIPMIITAGIMGWFGIPLKPSTLIIFSIALGITVDNTIHFLAHYRHEIRLKRHDLKECVAISIRETGLSIVYTSVILFFGFIVFVFSDFGGTQALGYLSAITYFVALFTNLILLPALLLSYERKLTTKSFEEPVIELYDDEDDTDWDLLTVEEKDESDVPDTGTEEYKYDSEDLDKEDTDKEKPADSEEDDQKQ